MPDLGSYLPQTFAYNTDGSINYVQVVVGINTWRQTYTYSAGKLVSVSDWIEQ